MRNLIRFFIRFQNIFLFIFLEAIAFVLIFNNNPYQRATFLNSGSGIAGYVYEQSKAIGNYFQLQKENAQLSVENAALKNLLFYNKKDTGSVAFYNDSMPQKEFYFIPARVVNNSVHRRMNYITIDKGSAEGIKPEMGVTSARGLVGSVKGTSKHYAIVTPILNTQQAISSKIGQTGFFGSLVWDGIDYEYAKLKAIENHADVIVGDTIFTSGFGSIFPAGITVGYIDKIVSDEDDDFYDITVRLAVDFKSLYYVEVIGNEYKHEIDSLKVLEESDD
ncbi:rod shape-determining protein MreC [Saccharicrinis sp. FJH54]|uniref:rod shape-determining protein MreC n=1 Tax=Saccharicrinis sp. FJH54 TaxID=3344665 RepID=UPI0035D4EA14